MKQLLYILLLSPLFIRAQAGSEKHFVITGQISDLKENSPVSLSDVNNPTDTLARGRVQKGGFVLKGSVPEPNLYHLNLEGAQRKMMLFIGNDAVQIKGDANKIQDLDVQGSPTHNDFKAFQKIFNPQFQKLTALSAKINSKPGIDPMDTLLVQYRGQLEQIGKLINEFVVARKFSPVAPFLILVTSELEQNPDVIEARISQLDPSVRTSFYGKILQQQLDKRSIGSIGSQAIEFTQNDTTGKPVSLASFRGKYVLIDFWASWCKPCRMENPNVVTAYNKFKDKNFTVLGVSLDRSKDSWLSAIREDRLAWTQVSDLKFWSNDVAVKYGIESIPQNFLVDPNGKIIGKNLRGDELQAKLCELLGCN